MNITHLSAHWKRLFHAEAIPGWAVLGWKLLGALSTFQYVKESLSPYWRFISSPAGNVVLILCGFAWLAAVVLWPRRSGSTTASAAPEKTWGDVMAEEDAQKIQERVKTASQHIEFHYTLGFDPYIEIISELWNGSVFELVSFGEISGHSLYAGNQLAGDPRVIVSVEPALLTLNHGDKTTLVVRQYVTADVADTMVANLNRGVAVDFQSVAVSFKMLPRGPGFPTNRTDGGDLGFR